MAQDDSEEDRSKWDHETVRSRRSAPIVYASAGLSLEDFQQDEWLNYLEGVARSADIQTNNADPVRYDQVARKSFRRHHEREVKRATIRNCQNVTDGSGRRGGGRDAWNKPTGDAFPFDGAELFGQIRPENERHPKRSRCYRARTPLQHLIERIVDEGLTVLFLEELSRHMKSRALEDAGLVRHYALLVSQAGFDTESLQPVAEVDDDLMLTAGDNKSTAELLTEFGYPTTVRDVENSKKRLVRSLHEVGAKILSRVSLSKKPKE